MNSKPFCPRNVVQPPIKRWVLYDLALLSLVLAALSLLALAASQMARPFHVGESLPISLDPLILP